MKRKILVAIFVCIFFVIAAVTTIWGIEIYQRESDPYWKMAKELYNMESALREIDVEWNLESLSQVTPFQYRNPDGNSITYYCCTTTYAGNKPDGFFGLHKEALDQVVDMDTLENRRDCEVNGLEAVVGELEGKTYLCWTISPTYSCVIEYVTGTIPEADIFRMAESVAED